MVRFNHIHISYIAFRQHIEYFGFTLCIQHGFWYSNLFSDYGDNMNIFVIHVSQLPLSVFFLFYSQEMKSK
jgi:hypothetical protein